MSIFMYVDKFSERTVMNLPPYKSFILAYRKSEIDNKMCANENENALKYTTTINLHKHLHNYYKI